MHGRGRSTQLDPRKLLRQAPKYIGEAMDDDVVDQLVGQIMSFDGSPELRRHLIDTIMAAEGQTDKELQAAIRYVTNILQNS